MAFPVKQKIWTISYNNVIADASLNAMMGNYLFTISQFLLANGYTCKGSCDGTTGAMDGVNRWAAQTDCDTRGGTTSAANSWMVLTDGNGCDILLSYVGSNDTIAYLAFSPGGLYVAAGTPTFTPTATDEVSIVPGDSTVINTTAATTTRHLFMWADSEAKLMRILLVMDGTPGTSANPGGVTWGVELFDAYLQSRTPTPAVWGFRYSGSSGGWNITNSLFSGFPSVYGAIAGSLFGGRCRINGQIVNLNGGYLMYAGNAAGGFPLAWCNVLTDLQGGAGYPIWGPLRVGSTTTLNTGITAQLYDWWSCRYNNSGTSHLGDTYDNRNFWGASQNGGVLWPGDGATLPVTGGDVAAQSGEHTGFHNAEDPAYGTFYNGASMYVPIPNGNITPTGPTPPQSIERRAGVQVIRLLEMPTDPTDDPDAGQLYWRMIDGQQAVFMKYPDGSVYEVGAG